MTEATTARKPRTVRQSTPEEKAKIAEENQQTLESLAEEPERLNLYQRIARIAKEAGALAPESKGGVPFAFRGVDGTVAHLTPFLHKYEVIVYPSAINHIVTDREVLDKQGNPTGRIVKTTQVETTFTVAGPDGDTLTVQTAGLADDFADRSTAQAQSVAYRVALLQLFHLPTHTKEPEETGEAVSQGRGAEAPAARGPKAVEAAKAAGATPAATPVVRLQAQAKALGQKLNKSGPELNAMGAEISGGKEQADWFSDPKVMQEIVDRLTAEANA